MVGDRATDGEIGRMIGGGGEGAGIAETKTEMKEKAKQRGKKGGEGGEKDKINIICD